MAFVLFVGHVEADLGGEGRKFSRQHRLGFAQDHFASGTAGDAAEDEHVAQVIEVGPMGHGIAEAGADGLVEACGPFIAGGHVFLNFHEALGQRERGGDVEACGRDEASDGLLAEELDAAAAVAAPFVGRTIRPVIDRGEGQFIEPTGDVALGGDQTSRGAGAHGDAEHGVDAERHGGGQRGDFAVIHHVEGDAIPLFAEGEEDVSDMGVEVFFGDATEQ